MQVCQITQALLSNSIRMGAGPLLWAGPEVMGGRGMRHAHDRQQQLQTHFGGSTVADATIVFNRLPRVGRNGALKRHVRSKSIACAVSRGMMPRWLLASAGWPTTDMNGSGVHNRKRNGLSCQAPEAKLCCGSSGVCSLSCRRGCALRYCWYGCVYTLLCYVLHAWPPSRALGLPRHRAAPEAVPRPRAGGPSSAELLRLRLAVLTGR